MNKIDRLFWLGIAIVVAEGIILLINGWRCPLEDLAKRYTECTEVGFDIFLPKWLAKNNKTFFAALFSVGVIIAIFRLLT